MSTFRDSRGDEWSFAITLETALRVKRDHGVDLLKFQEWTGQLASDQYLHMAVLFACLDQDQVRSRAVDLPEFLKRLGGELFETALDVWFETVADFFPKRLQAPAHAIRRTLNDRLTKATAAVQELEQTGQLQTLVEQVVDASLISGKPSSAPQGSSESIRSP